MPTRISLWRLAEDGEATQVAEEPLAAEALIESAVESAPELLGINALIIGRQVPTPSGTLDLLAINADAQLVVVENKRDKTPRDVLAQVIDYAAAVADWTLDEAQNIYQAYRARTGDLEADLVGDFEENFGEPLEGIAKTPLMIVVASRLDDSTEKMIDFLADHFDVPINAVLFQPFEGGLIGRTWLRPEEATQRTRHAPTANTRRRDEAKVFWDKWLPIGREALPDIHLPENGPRAVLIARRITSGLPVNLTVWVHAAEAHAEVVFDDGSPDMNERMLSALSEHQVEIESAFGEPLDWRSLELPNRRTKVVAPKVAIEDKTNPTNAGLHALADSASRLVAAVLPRLTESVEQALSVTAEADEEVASLSQSL